ncbi:hypothetical protein TNCV_1734211 [Trichonephila clavipes]|nr:hypothetical protein TNCV_1734211 [Trichonephila clavipes]
MVVNVTMKREMSFICPQDVKNPGGILFHFREGPLRKCLPLCGICWQKFMARLQFVRVQLEDSTKNIADNDGGKPNRLAASRALLVPEAASDAIASISTAMQGARSSFKHGRPACASNFPVSSKRLTSFKKPAGVKGPFHSSHFSELVIYARQWSLIPRSCKITSPTKL